MKNIWLHFKKICIHKFWVAYYCFKCGLYWQGIIHDLSKFSPIEFWESVKYYQGTSSPINAAKADKGYSLAWQHHKGRNPHHYEYWTDNYDKGTTFINIPYKYLIELVCDYLGAARAYMGNTFTYEAEQKWWENKMHTNIAMNHNCQIFVNEVFRYLAWHERMHYSIRNIDKLLNKKYLKELYNTIMYS